MWLEWIVGCMLLAFGGLSIVGNWQLMIAMMLGKWGGSYVLIFGGVFAFIGCALVPALGWRIGLVCLALDPGCFLFVVGPLSLLVAKLRDRGELI